MIRKAAGWFLDKLISWMEKKERRVDARSFVEEHYTKFLKDISLTPGVRRDLHKLESLMVRLGWLQITTFSDYFIKEEQVIDADWLEKFESHQVISKGILVAGTGKYLDYLDEHPSPKNKLLVSTTLEDLLRHTEVKREQSFARFRTDLSKGQIDLERHTISILFSQAACRHNDLRFLNAAFKLNEWRMKDRIYRSNKENLARYMLALAEQELAAKELLV
jgi:hypothetical protein